MILHLALLLQFQLAGEVGARLWVPQVPGPVLGLALFAVALIASPRRSRLCGRRSPSSCATSRCSSCRRASASPLLNALKVRDRRTRGLATGVAAHGIGTARAFQIDERTGAYASLGMGLNGLATAVLAPLVAQWLM